MIGRFIAAPRSHAGALPEGWTRHDLGGWIIAVAPGEHIALNTRHLLILGELHPLEPEPLSGQLMSRVADQLLRGLGPDQVWGRYVALSAPGNGLRVYRDPSGAVPVFCKPSASCPLVFSDPEPVCALRLVQPEVDWQGLAHRLFYPQLQVRRTGWDGILECLPGQQMLVGRSAISRSLWTPWAHTDEQALDPNAATQNIRTQVLAAVAALVGPHRSILLELSGGLDSSILAAGLAMAGAHWSASNLFTPAQDGDERFYAREVAARWQVPLAEASLDPADVDLLALPRRLQATPGGLGMIAAADRLHETALRDSGADALMSGTGGDNVFCSLRSAAPVVDAARSHRIALAAAAARDLADLTGTSLWSAARAALRYQRFDHREPDRWPGLSTLLHADALPPFDSHPWLDAPLGRLPGKRAHVVLLLRAHSVVQAIDRAHSQDMIFPLLSQPVVEACLAVPTWRWIADGRDRAMARDAFRDLLPASVHARRVKGRLESWLTPAFTRQRKQIREVLLDGRLAAHGIVDRAAIERATGDRANADDPAFATLMRLVDAELWLASFGQLPSGRH